MSELKRGLKNVSYLTFGNFTSQLIGMIGFVYIIRMLGPSDYGIYTTVGVFVGMFGVFSLVGLRKVVLRECCKDLTAVQGILEKTVGLRILLALMAIGLCVISSFFTKYDNQVKLYIVIFTVEILYSSLSGYISIIYQAFEEMKYIAFFDIVNRIILTSLSVLILYLGFGLLYLFVVVLFSHILTLILKYQLSKRFVTFRFLSKPHFDKSLLKMSFSFSLLSFVQGLSTRIDLLMISFLGSLEDVGIYGVSFNIVKRFGMIRNLFAIAFFPTFVKRFEDGTVKGSVLIKYSVRFFILVFFLFTIFSLFVEQLTLFLFGPQFEESGAILKVLMFYVSFKWATIPFTNAAQATHNENSLIFAYCIMACLNIPLNIIFFSWYGLIGIAYSTLIVFSIGSSLICGITYRNMKKQGYLA